MTSLGDDLPADLVDLPAEGRCFRATRRVRLGDAGASGRLRLDALARLLQDVGNDDFADAGLDPSSPWVARRAVVWAPAWPRLGDRLHLTTFCGGLGGRWAERRTSITTDSGTTDSGTTDSGTTEAGGRVEVAVVWVHLDGRGRPARLPDWFVETYGPTADGRAVSARLRLPGPADVDGATTARPWPLRATDLDVLGHVNNAATWAPVEDELARLGVVPRRAELEYGAAIEPGDPVTLRSTAADGVVRIWLEVDGTVRAAALVDPA